MEGFGMIARAHKLTKDDVIEYFTTLSNWGRWGDDDRLGTLNLITPEVRKAAATLVRTGKVVSLSRDVDPRGPQDPLKSGLGITHRYMMIDEVGAHRGRGQVRWDAVTEQTLFMAHGSNTHLDGLAHYNWDRKNYNGFSVDDNTSSILGSTKLSVHQASQGIITRGVLLDIAGLRGVEWLEPGMPIYIEDLEAAMASQDVVVRSGDALLIHTGHVAQTLKKGPDPKNQQSGLHVSCMPWLRRRDISVLVGDCIHDVQPSGFDGFDLFRPVHAIALVAMGLWLIDNAELTELAVACKAEKRWEFFFATLPYRFVGVTGSLVNPIAMF